MKRFFLIFFCLFFVFGLTFTIFRTQNGAFDENPSNSESQNEPAGVPYERKFTKAIWLSQYDLSPVFLSGGAQRKRADFCRIVGQVLDNCATLGFDTVIVQVRPNGDSMYPSELFFSSAYVTGAYGRELLYDPFEIIVSLCRDRGLSVHAWINPLRLVRTEEIALIGAEYPVRRWWESAELRGKYVVEHEGRLYLNPAYEEVRRLISKGAAELAERYLVDGVHMDDYFYPHGIGEDFDSEAYENFSEGLSLSEFRRQNISELVLSVNRAVKEKNQKALFGISPGGNLETVFNTDYADVYKWCAEEGYIDYICPQIYFGLRHETHGFDKVYSRWANILRHPSVSLFVGITLHKAENASLGIGDEYAGSGKNEWIESRSVLADCLGLLKGESETDGVVLFSYRHFFDPETGKENPNTADERNNFIPVFKSME